MDEMKWTMALAKTKEDTPYEYQGRSTEGGVTHCTYKTGQFSKTYAYRPSFAQSLSRQAMAEGWTLISYLDETEYTAGTITARSLRLVFKKDGKLMVYDFYTLSNPGVFYVECMESHANHPTRMQMTNLHRLSSEDQLFYQRIIRTGFDEFISHTPFNLKWLVSPGSIRFIADPEVKSLLGYTEGTLT